ncbi:HNH endonuclease signature motif containing protein [Streptomyces javensis]|uniref:HNH endonuclease signature motif containing protein n=1 Tax=Streptomyces javensis TaxID=114698 RepID=UPI0033DBFF0B
MAISGSARKVLWARSSGICAFSGCDQELTINLLDEGSKMLEEAGVPLGEEAHIISGSKGGPRYDGAYPPEKIDSYENLILLCPTHHRLIDKKGGAGFTVESLRKMKVAHEVVQRAAKSASQKRQEETELRTLALIEVWADKADLNHWDGFSGMLNTPIPRLSSETIDALVMQLEWITTRRWPDQYPELKRAFENYTLVLTDTLNHIRRTMDSIDGRVEIYEMYREYKHRRMTQSEYDASRRDFEFRVDMLYELSFELTKAANFICDAVRTELDPLYRFEEGIVPHRVSSGLFGNKLTREEYRHGERERELPYVGRAELEARVRKQGGASR